ncbi:uncharacterized protein EAF02_006579 [Botrytis sinoallii]|uniref:uncharacterized protein n=1 Tax=Botrytis sinoallii TaxID=1463999 RepID=UPI001900C4E9|nr:uncharacterized protein EAF02_006579 [Botrytis sinoallii]KAF7881891.1 hypothetical protein EAF02_006579 [Botrytis sinoallii]
MAPAPRAGATLVTLAAFSSSSSSWSDPPYSHGPTIPIIASTVTRILDRCSLTSIASVSDSNAAPQLHCLAALSEAAINKHYKRPFFAQPFTKKADLTIFVLACLGGFVLIAILVSVCSGIKQSSKAKKREEEEALARARINTKNTWGR